MQPPLPAVPTTPAPGPALGSGWDGLPWPELWRQRPVLVIPGRDGRRPADPAAGWSALEEHRDQVQPGWQVSVTGRHLTIAASAGPWYDGDLLLTREWTRAVRAARRLLLVTGDFHDLAQFMDPSRAGTLRLLTAPAAASLPTGVPGCGY